MTPGNVIVVDTNIWLDHFLGNRPKHASAKNFLCEARRQDIPLVIPSHAVKDVFFMVQQQLKAANRIDGKLSEEAAALCARKTAWAIVDNIMEMAAIGPSDQSDAWIASKQRTIHPDYEDNLVIATAMRLNARLLVTNDKSLLKHSSVPAMDADDAHSLILLDRI